MSDDTIKLANFGYLTQKLQENNIDASEEELSSLFSQTLENSTDGTVDINDFTQVLTNIYGIDDDSEILSVLSQMASVNNVENTTANNDLSAESSKEAIAELFESQLAELESSFETAKSQNGGIGKLWDGIKNLTHIGAGSSKAQNELNNLKQQIEDYKNGKIDLATTYKNITGKDATQDDLNKLLNGEIKLSDVSTASEKIEGYAEGQKMCVDTVADMASGIVSVGVVAFGSAIGICAAPFTAGASLGLVAAGLTMAAGAGAIVKTGIKAADSAIGGREYNLKNAGYDLITGAANGAMGVFSNGLAGSAGKAVMKAAGMEALETTVVKSAAVAGGKAVVEQAAKNVTLSAGKQMAVKAGVFVVEATIDGGLSGAMDAFSRDVAQNMTNGEDEKDKDILEILKDTTSGFVGGAAGGIVIGGAMRGASKLGNLAGETQIGQNAGQAIKKIGGDISETLSDGLDMLGGKAPIVNSIRESLSNFGVTINDRFVATSLKNAVTQVDDNIYSVAVGNYSVQIAKEELSEEIIEAINNGDNSLIFTKAQMVISEALADSAADETAEIIARESTNNIEADTEINSTENNETKTSFKDKIKNLKENLKEKAKQKIDQTKTSVKEKLKKTKLGEYYTQAEANFHNTPDIQNADSKVMKEFGEYVDSLRTFIQDEEAFSGFSDKIKQQLTDIQENSIELTADMIMMNDELADRIQERTDFIKGLITQIESGEDVSEETIKLAQKALDLTELFDEKTISTLKAMGVKLERAQELTKNCGQTVISTIDATTNHIGEIGEFAEDAITLAQELPDTNAFKQLGEMPKRAKAIYDEIQSDVSTLKTQESTIRTKILDGNIEEGLEDLEKYYADLEAFQSKLDTMQGTIEETGERAGLFETFTTLIDRAKTRSTNPIFTSSSKTQQAQALIEEANIALPKFIQTMSSDESIPEGVRSFFKEFTSNCTTTRTIEEAQSLANELYGAGKYTIQKSFGAGSIGETYLVTDETGKEFVMKMLKTNAYMEKFEADRSMFVKYIEEFVTDEADKDYKLKLINGLFDAWEKELDYGAEAQAAKEMANGAKRFSVAQTVALGQNSEGVNVSLVMEKAEGIGLDDLISLLKFKNEHPKDYLTLSIVNSDGKELNPWIKKANDLAKNPWIYNTESYAEKLPVVYQKAQNEQSMFMSKEGVKTVHADPHGGNVFISFDEQTQTPKITYIDTGNVVTRTNEEMLGDITLALNMLIGNSEGIATSLLKGATIPEGTTQEEMITKVAQLLDEKLYKAGVNLKDVNYTQSVMLGTLKELNIIPNASNSNLLKANLQRIKTSREIFDVTGTISNKKIDMKDMLIGLAQSFKTNPKETIEASKPIIKWALNNKNQALLTFFQMLFHFE